MKKSGLHNLDCVYSPDFGKLWGNTVCGLIFAVSLQEAEMLKTEPRCPVALMDLLPVLYSFYNFYNLYNFECATKR